MFEYQKTPAKIYQQSFATIIAEAELSRFSVDERDVVIRLIHACGMVDLAGDIVISTGAIAVGNSALRAGCTIICDVEMVQRGIIVRALPANNSVFCNIKSEQAVSIAAQLGTTRSAGAIASLAEHLPGSIVTIGNAPTALFHLLEMMAEGMAPPALIIGCPVGFVGAVESKEALISSAGDVPYITVRGRRGGSAMAAAALNALAGGLGA